MRPVEWGVSDYFDDEAWTPAEPTDGLARTDRYGVTWTPADGVWWAHLGHTHEETDEPVQQYRQWRDLSQRGPFEVKR